MRCSPRPAPAWPHVCGGDLEGDELALVEAWLAENPDAKAALEAVRAEKSTTFAANDNIVPPRLAIRHHAEPRLASPHLSTLRCAPPGPASP